LMVGVKPKLNVSSSEPIVGRIALDQPLLRL
jgi:hypothetical protein